MILKKINWDTVYQKQSPELLGLCLRYVKNKSLAEDLLHDAFLIAIDKIVTYKKTGSFNGWLKKIVLNTVLQHLRQGNRLEICKEYDEEIMQYENQTETVVNQKHLITQADFTKEDIVEILNQLPQNHKIVFNLYVFENQKHNQISRMLNISVGTSKSCLSRARKRLVELLYVKAKDQELEEKKKRKVVAALLFIPAGDGFVDRYYKNRLNSFKVNPEQALSFDEAKDVKLFPQSLLIKTISLIALVSAIVVGGATINLPFEKVKKNPNQTETTILFSSQQSNMDKNDKSFVQVSDTLLLSQKYEKGAVQASGVHVDGASENENLKTEKKNIYTAVKEYKEPLSIRKEKSPVISYYFLSHDVESSIIGREKIEFSILKNKIDDPVLHFYEDSTFCFKYNRHFDTVSILDPEKNEMVVSIIEKSDNYCGDGWCGSYNQYANFIVNDSLRLQYGLCMTDNNKVLFVKRETVDINQNKQVKKVVIGVKKLNKNS